MTTSNICILVTIAIYLIGMLAIGVSLGKSSENSTDFYLGGRKMGPFVTAMSAEASDMSSWLLMGLPGLAYLSGVCDPAWIAIGLGIGTYLNWLLVARPIRRYSSNLNAITVPQFYSKRYHDDSNILSAISALAIIIFFVPYTASGFAACGKLFNSLFGIDYTVAMLVSALVIIAYTVMGGFSAVSFTDLVQSLVMSLALVAVVWYGIIHAGGLTAVIDNAKALPGYFSLTSSYDPVSGVRTSYGPIKIISTMAWGLGYFGMPHILLRFMAIEDEKKLVLSRRIASVWVVFAMFVAIFIGIVGLGMTDAGALKVLEGGASETLIVEIAHLLSSGGIFSAIIAGLILAGILAATMSTADSQLLAAASAVSQNIMQEFLHLKLSEKQSLVAARLTIVIVSILGIFLARDPNSSVFGIVSFAWAGFGGAFGAITLCSLLWKRSNKQGALAGIISGGTMVFVWKYFVRPMGGIWDIYELLPAFIISLLCTVIISLITPKPNRQIEKEFEEAKVK